MKTCKFWDVDCILSSLKELEKFYKDGWEYWAFDPLSERIRLYKKVGKRKRFKSVRLSEKARDFWRYYDKAGFYHHVSGKKELLINCFEKFKDILNAKISGL